MQVPLFNGSTEVTNDMVIGKMEDFINQAKKLMELYEQDVKLVIKLARDLRNELKAEYKNNDLQRIQKAYEDNNLFFRHYKSGIADAYVSTVGQLTRENVYSFLYDVNDYMYYHLPSEYKE